MTMTHEVASFAGKIAKIDGAPASGKTACLIERCVRLLTDGHDPANIHVFVSSTEAARAFKKRLQKALVSAEWSVDVAACSTEALSVGTVKDACVKVLNTPEARAFTKRVPHALTSFEYTFLLEDVMTLGQPMRRLKAMMNHFKESLAADAPLNEVARPGEEAIVFEYLVSVLQFEEAMLPEEVAWHANAFLTAEEGRAFAHTFPYVLVDDFQNLSEAEQHFCCHVAKTQLMVAGCAEEAVAVSSAYPSPEGFTTFDTLRTNVTTFTLGEEVSLEEPSITNKTTESGIWGGDARAAARKGDSQADVKAGTQIGAQVAGTQDSSNQVAADNSTVRFIRWDTPEEELGNLTKLVRVIANAEDDTPYSESVVIAPNRRWARALKQMLESRGFRTTMVGFNRIGGDPRVADRARALDAYTRMRLLADPTDARAWRVFAGLGNYLCRSDAWSGFMAYAAEKSLSLNDARLALRRELEEGAEEPFLLARTLNERFEVAQSFIDENRGASGFALLNVCGCDTLPEFEELSTHLDGSESATSIASLLERLQSDVVFAPDSRALRIAPFEALAGLSFKNVYAAGLVDGFMPNRNAFEVVSTDEARNRIITTERRAFVNGLTKCRAQLILSTFATAPLELAERTHAQVVRIRSVEGKRRAYLRHTCFIDEAGHAAPSVEGGQAVLASYGID